MIFILLWFWFLVRTWTEFEFTLPHMITYCTDWSLVNKIIKVGGTVGPLHHGKNNNYDYLTGLLIKSGNMMHLVQWISSSFKQTQKQPIYCNILWLFYLEITASQAQWLMSGWTVPLSPLCMMYLQWAAPTISDFGKTGSYFTEKMFPGFPSDVLRLLCLNSPWFTEIPKS